MATTTNYGWTTPDDTALVKDGAAAIRSLGTAIDTSMNTALGTKKAGLVLLNTTSFSAQSSVSISNVFSSTYDNYLILVYISAITTAAAGLQLRLRTTTDDSSNLYYFAAVRQDPATYSTNVYGSNPGTSFSISDATNRTMTSVFLGSPNLADETQMRTEADGDAYRNVRVGGYLNTTTQYTGFTIFPTANNITGKVATYGYQL